MNTFGQFRTAAIFVVGFCLILSAFSAPTSGSGKVYIIRDLKTAIEKDFLVGVEMAINEKGEEIFAGVFDVMPLVWDSYLKKEIPDTAIIVEVSIEQVPVIGLLEIIKYRSELYSDVLPALLSNSSPKKVSENLSSELFQTLTVEAKRKISPEDMAELTKLYGQ